MQIYSTEGASTPLFVDVLDELLPEENGDDDLDEVDPASLPPARQRGKAKCGECDMICRNQYLLEKHIKARHEKKTQDASKSCPYCGKSFKGATTRRQHMVQCAMQPRTDHCQCEGACGCRSVTSSSSTLMSSPAPALPASSAATPAPSSASQRPRLRSANLSGDLSACTLNPPCFTCSECKKTFVSAANLIRHRNKYHERLVLDFPKQ